MLEQSSPLRLNFFLKIAARKSCKEERIVAPSMKRLRTCRRRLGDTRNLAKRTDTTVAASGPAGAVAVAPGASRLAWVVLVSSRRRQPSQGRPGRKGARCPASRQSELTCRE